MNKFIVSIIFSLSAIFGAQSGFSTPSQTKGFDYVLNSVEEQGQLKNADAKTIALAQAIVTELLTSPDASSLLREEDGHLVLDEANAHYLFGSIKDAAKAAINKGLEKYYDTKWYASEKYDSFQEKLDEKMPGFRNAIADALVIVNDTLSKIDPKIVGSIIKIAGQIIGGVSSIIGAAFGVPVIPGLAISLATGILGNSYTISGALAGAKTLLDIAEALLRVDPNTPPQSDEEKGNALKKIAEAISFVGRHYAENFAVYKPDEVELIKSSLKAIGKIYAAFM